MIIMIFSNLIQTLKNVSFQNVSIISGGTCICHPAQTFMSSSTHLILSLLWCHLRVNWLLLFPRYVCVSAMSVCKYRQANVRGVCSGIFRSKGCFRTCIANSGYAEAMDDALAKCSAAVSSQKANPRPRSQIGINFMRKMHCWEHKWESDQERLLLSESDLMAFLLMKSESFVRYLDRDLFGKSGFLEGYGAAVLVTPQGWPFNHSAAESISLPCLLHIACP